jgi:hypothetical protein
MLWPRAYHETVQAIFYLNVCQFILLRFRCNAEMIAV